MGVLAAGLLLNIALWGFLSWHYPALSAYLVLNRIPRSELWWLSGGALVCLAANLLLAVFWQRRQPFLMRLILIAGTLLQLIAGWVLVSLIR